MSRNDSPQTAVDSTATTSDGTMNEWTARVASGGGA
jgi:hypothetical protein